MRPGNAEPSARVATLCATLLVALGFTTRLRYGYEWDELQLLEGAWNVAHGRVPYRDFFEHHPPLLHLLLAPVVGGPTEVTWPLLVALRLAALAVLAGIMVTYGRLVRHAAGPIAARWAPVAFLVVSPFSGKLFDLRADWLALLALLAALLLVVRPADATGERALLRAAAAGICGGVAIGFSQKAIPLWLGVGAWVVAGVAAPAPPGGRARSLVVAAVVLAASALPALVLTLWFARQGAAGALYTGVIDVNLDWPRELGWQLCWWESSRAAAGPIALAVGAVAGVGGPLRRRSPEALAAVLLACGVLAYVRTPVPWEQSLLPPLEQAPDQITSRLFVALSVIEVPVVNVAEPVLPTTTLIPAGFELTRSPPRPVAVTDSVADCGGGGGGAGGFTDSVAVLLTPPKAPPIVTDVAVLTPLVVMLKLALVVPTATVTLAGTPATAVLLLDSVTTAPPVGAAAVKVTVPVLEAPPTTLVGLTVTADKVGDAGAGLTVNVAARVTPPKVAEIEGAVEAVTTLVAIAKVALVAPAATVTVAATVAAAVLELLRLTTAPPLGAPAVSVTVRLPPAAAPPRRQ